MSKTVRFIAVNNTTAAKLRKALSASRVIKLPKYISGRRAGYEDKIKRAIAGNSMGLTHEHVVKVCFHMPNASDYDIYAVSEDAASSFILMSTEFEIKRMFANTVDEIGVFATSDIPKQESHLRNLYTLQLEQQGFLRHLNINLSLDVADLIAANQAACERYVELIKQVNLATALVWDNKW